MGQGIRCQPLTAEVKAQSQACPCVICGGQSGTRPGVPPSISISPRLSFRHCSVHIHSSVNDAV